MITQNDFAADFFSYGCQEMCTNNVYVNFKLFWIISTYFGNLTNWSLKVVVIATDTQTLCGTVSAKYTNISWYSCLVNNLLLWKLILLIGFKVNIIGLAYAIQTQNLMFIGNKHLFKACDIASQNKVSIINFKRSKQRAYFDLDTQLVRVAIGSRALLVVYSWDNNFLLSCYRTLFKILYSLLKR